MRAHLRLRGVICILQETTTSRLQKEVLCKQETRRARFLSGMHLGCAASRPRQRTRIGCRPHHRSPSSSTSGHAMTRRPRTRTSSPSAGGLPSRPLQRRLTIVEHPLCFLEDLLCFSRTETNGTLRRGVEERARQEGIGGVEALRRRRRG